MLTWRSIAFRSAHFKYADMSCVTIDQGKDWRRYAFTFANSHSRSQAYALKMSLRVEHTILTKAWQPLQYVMLVLVA